MHRLRLQRDTLREPRVETFPSVEVESRSGVHPAEAALLHHLDHLGEPRRLLMVGSRTGAAAMAAAMRWPDCHVRVHVLDVHHARAVRRHVEANGLDHRVELHLAPFVDGWNPPGPPPGSSAPFDAALLQLGAGDEPGELALDWVREIWLALQPGARVVVAAEKAAPWLLRELREAFHAGPGPVQRSISVVRGVRRAAPEKIKNHLAHVDLTLPGWSRSLELVTLPGVFAHRRIDAGAQALAESVEAGPDDTVLDMGCGCGAVGLALAVHRQAGPVTFLDSHARAIWCAKENTKRSGVDHASFLLEDQGLDGPARHTVFAGNPPYYSQHRIDELFLQTARRALLPGGRIYLVAKNTSWLLPRTRELFQDVTLRHRRGYGIIQAFQGKSAGENWD